jgi:hypothetical protein
LKNGNEIYLSLLYNYMNFEIYNKEDYPFVKGLFHIFL